MHQESEKFRVNGDRGWWRGQQAWRGWRSILMAVGLMAALPLASPAFGQAYALQSVDWKTTINGEAYRVKDVYVLTASEQTRILAVFNLTIVLLAEPGAVFVQAPIPEEIVSSPARPTCSLPEWSPLWAVDTYLAIGGEQCESAAGFWFTPGVPPDLLANSGSYSGAAGWFLIPPLFECQTAGPDNRVRIMRLSIREEDWHPNASVALAVTVAWLPWPQPAGMAQFADLGANLTWPIDPATAPEQDEPGVGGYGPGGGGGGGGGGASTPEALIGSFDGAATFWRSSQGFLTSWTIEESELVAATAWNQAIPEYLASAGRGDFDGDGDIDFLFRSLHNGSVEMWKSNEGELGNAVFVGHSLSSFPAEWSIIAIADVSGDGRDDIIWRRSAGSSQTVRVWVMNGATILADLQLGMSIGLEFLGCGDLNGDGRADFAWRTYGGNILAWRTNENLTATPMMLGNAPVLAGAWRAERLADLDGDGDADIVWHNVQTGQVNGWLVQNFARVGGGVIAPFVPAWWQVIDATDLNDDGTDDLLWRNQSTGRVNNWCMNGLIKSSGGTIGVAPWQWTPF